MTNKQVLEVYFWQSWPCAPHHPAHELGLQVRSWKRIIHGAKNSAQKSHSGFSFILLTKPLVHPTIAAAPSVQILVQLSHFSFPISRYSDVTKKVFYPVVVFNFLQTREFPLITLLSTKRTFAKNCKCLQRFVLLPICKANFLQVRTFSQTNSFDVFGHVINSSGNCVIW